MNKAIWLFCSIFCFGSITSAQYPSSVYITRSGIPRTAAAVEAMKRVYDQERSNARFDRLQNLNSQQHVGGFAPFDDGFSVKAKSYLKPSAERRSQYAGILKMPNAGMIVLVPEIDCLPEQDKKANVKELVKACPSHFVIGHARYYSFRKKDYSGPTRADVGISGDWILSLGALNQGILVNLGDVPLEGLTLTSKGIDFLDHFVPATDPTIADQQLKEYEVGVVNGGLIYQHMLPIEVGKTYGLRVIAYKTDLVSEVKFGQTILKIEPFSGDLREDLIVVFQIVNHDPKTGVTLLWRQLSKKESPLLRMQKENK